MTEPSGGDHRVSTPSAAPRRFRWIHTVTDRVPTGWFAGILTIAFLTATAAFGGLASVAAPVLPELRAGDTHTNDQLALTIERALLVDELPEAGVYVEPGERVLAVVLTAENRWDQPLYTAPNSSATAAIRIDGLGDVPADSVARLDDAELLPWLQPRVPAQLVLAWIVDASAFADGDELRLDLRDETLFTGQFVTFGQQWGDPVTAAHLALELQDIGAGADTAEGEAG